MWRKRKHLQKPQQMTILYNLVRPDMETAVPLLDDMHDIGKAVHEVLPLMRIIRPLLLDSADEASVRLLLQCCSCPGQAWQQALELKHYPQREGCHPRGHPRPWSHHCLSLRKPPARTASEVNGQGEARVGIRPTARNRAPSSLSSEQHNIVQKEHKTHLQCCLRTAGLYEIQCTVPLIIIVWVFRKVLPVE